MSGTPPARIRVTVLLFARYAEALGTPSLSMELAHPATIASVLDSLRAQPRGELLPPKPLVARNREHAPYETSLADGDEVAILPALAGG